MAMSLLSRLLRRVLALAAVVAALFIGWEWLTFPDVSGLARENPKTTAFMERRRAELRTAGKDDTLEWKWVAIEGISPNLRRAVLVSEDSAFYEHKGVDFDQIRRSFEENLEKGEIARGGSTITQQLAKNLYLSPSKNPYRKVRELLITKSLEKHLTKKRILEIYLNVVEFGERTYGADAAARRYFGRPASALSDEQAALLAGSLPNPRRMNPAAPNRRLLSRQKIILKRMQTWGRWLE
jgi:monofunctional biosynthetic peptidoglycan transglycosylase